MGLKNFWRIHDNELNKLNTSHKQDQTKLWDIEIQINKLFRKFKYMKTYCGRVLKWLQ